jgi:cytochrome c
MGRGARSISSNADFIEFTPLKDLHVSFRSIALCVAVGAVAATVSLPVLASKELAQKNACMACHAPDRKLVGPAYQEVAKKYAGDKEALAKLTASIRAGGAGKWGPVPMPAQPNLSDADAQALAAWVMGGGK